MLRTIRELANLSLLNCTGGTFDFTFYLLIINVSNLDCLDLIPRMEAV